MSELKVFDIVVAEEGYCEGIVKYRRAVYDKAEADKVIAEKDKEIAKLKKNIDELQDKVKDLLLRDKNMALNFNNVFNALVHHKYKRCLDQVEICRTSSVYFFRISEGEKDEGKAAECRRASNWFDKWEERWLELAERFKEAK
jgi:hypothetical protein